MESEGGRRAEQRVFRTDWSGMKGPAGGGAGDEKLEEK